MSGDTSLRVLYVTDTWDAPARYRCFHAARQLRAAGAAANVLHLDDPTLPDVVPQYGLVVLFRLPWDARVAAVVANRGGARLVFDCDDLIFDPGVATLLPFLDELPADQRRAYHDRFPRLRRTFDACDAFVGSTPTLARFAATLGKPAFVHPNLVPPEYERTARRLRRLPLRAPAAPGIAYLSGSNTHDRDLASIAGALARVLTSHPTVRLLLCGFVHVPQALLPFAARIDRVPYLHWRVYPWALARCRATVAPAAVVNDFADAKSALKFFEAGVFGVPTVATPTASFRDAIADGVDGLLASTEEEWVEKLGRTLDPAAAATLGAAARTTVATRFSFAAHAGRLAELLAPLAGAPTGPPPAPGPLDADEPAPARARLRASAKHLRERAYLALGRPRDLTVGRRDVLATTVSLRDPAPFEALLATVAARGPAHVRQQGPVIHPLVEGSHGWERWTPIGDLRRAPGATFTSAGIEPGLEGPGVALRTADFRYLLVRVRAAVGIQDARAQLFWLRSDATDFTEEESAEWLLVADGREHTYVVDLAAGPWTRAGTVTRLRFDPIDCGGTVTLGQMALIADLAQLEAGVDARIAFARHYLAGRGLECGALQNPLPMPPGAQVLYIDRLTDTDARRHYPELDGWPLVRPHLVGDLHRLPVATGSLDFCVGNHLLEHARDPIGSLEEMLRVVRPGGMLFVSVPDIRNPIDSRRPLTPFAHLLDDHDPTLDRRGEDRAHFFEATASGHPQLSAAEQRALAERRLAQDYSIHFHTFDEDSYRQLLAWVGARSGATVVEYARHRLPDCDEYIAVLRAGEVAAETADAAVAPAVDVVIPIYGARAETIACVESVLRHATGDWRLVLVDDASPDPELAAWLDALAAADARVRLLRNEVNQGFVVTANRGMREAGGRDVLLLNSDTVVPAGFLDRLRAAAYADATTGIVSPLSNNATICSVPEWCRPNPLPPGFTLDEFAAFVADTSACLRPPLVTAVGFCMYVRAAVLERVGLFDAEHFPRGYGEENDFCERALAAGWRVRLADDVYVWHAGEASFGGETEGLKRDNGAVLDRLHPDYFAKVARFVRENPLAAVHENLRFALGRRGGRDPALLVLLHAPVEDAGGGTEHHVRDLVRTLRAPRVVVAVPEPDGLHVTEIVDGDLHAATRFHVPLASAPDRFMLDRPEMAAALRTVVQLFGVGAAHIHHLLYWPLRIWRTLDELGVPFAVTVHDYYCVCPSLNLIDAATGRLCCAAGPADPAACLTNHCDSLGHAPFPDPAATLRAHQAEFGVCLRAARVVIFPSQTAQTLVTRTFELREEQLRVIPHGYAGPGGQVVHAEGRPEVHVAILGQVANLTKGAALYRELLARTRTLPIVWHVFGDTRPHGYDETLRAIGLGDRLVLHGGYKREEIGARLAEAGVDLGVLLPIWPETFSYTLSELLGAGVPVVVSDQGALAERVGGEPFGRVVAGVDDAVAAVEALVRDRTQLRAMQAAAAGYRHRSLVEMADEHAGLYRELLTAGPPPARLGAAEWRRLREARRAAVPVAAGPPPAPLLPHYQRWWYPIYERLAPLVPASLRRMGRARVAARWWQPVRAYRFDRASDIGIQPSGLELVGARARRATYRTVDRDAFFLLPTEPFEPSRVRVIRFEMRFQARGFAFAQLYWSHEGDPGFSETKSIQIPLQADDDGWREYTILLDQVEERERWDAGERIHQLRFDPLNLPGTVELSELSLCAPRR